MSAQPGDPIAATLVDDGRTVMLLPAVSDIVVVDGKRVRSLTLSGTRTERIRLREELDGARHLTIVPTDTEARAFGNIGLAFFNSQWMFKYMGGQELGSI